MSEPEDKPPLPGRLRPFVETAIVRHERRPRPNPRVLMRKKEDGLWRVESPYRKEDHDSWLALVGDAFGSRSESVIWTFIDQLRGLVGHYHDGGHDWRPNEFELNAMIGLILGAKPRNEMEAVLAAQMVAVHMLTMRSAATALGDGDGGPPRPEFATLTARLVRASCDQMNTMRKLKSRGGRQNITVRYERHEHRHDHRHAHVHEAGEGGEEIGTQAQRRTRAHGGRKLGAEVIEAVGSSPGEPCAALPGPDATGDGLPEAGEEGAAQVLAPRVRSRVRRTLGQGER